MTSKILIQAQIGAAMFGFSLAVLLAPPADLPYWARVAAMFAVFFFGVGGVATAVLAARGFLGRVK